MTTALLHLEALEIMHADVKPENIMVVDRRQQPLQVKLIDFGLARSVSDAAPGSCVQTLWYRSVQQLESCDGDAVAALWSSQLGLGESGRMKLSQRENSQSHPLLECFRGKIRF